MQTRPQSCVQHSTEWQYQLAVERSRDQQGKKGKEKGKGEREKGERVEKAWKGENNGEKMCRKMKENMWKNVEKIRKKGEG